MRKRERKEIKLLLKKIEKKSPRDKYYIYIYLYIRLYIYIFPSPPFLQRGHSCPTRLPVEGEGEEKEAGGGGGGRGNKEDEQ